jgi:alkyl hydroperoxide reductase subunit F
MSMHELVVVGAGPAGITASIYAARKRMEFLVVTRDIGGRTMLSSGIENYTGYQYISGAELAKKFEEHMKEFDIQVKFDEVREVVPSEGGFRVIGSEG